MTAHLVTPIVVFTLMATATAACSTSTGVAPGTGEGSALSRDTTSATSATSSTNAKDAKDDHANLPKGELMGTGVGAAAGALYDVKKRRPE